MFPFFLPSSEEWLASPAHNVSEEGGGKTEWICNTGGSQANKVGIVEMGC